MPTWCDSIADIFLQSPNLKTLALDLFIMGDFTPGSQYQPLLLQLCSAYTRRGESRGTTSPSPLRLKTLVVLCNDPKSESADVVEKGWKGWADVVGTMVDLKGVEVLRLGGASSEPVSGGEVNPGAVNASCVRALLTSEVTPRLQILVVAEYTKVVYDLVLGLEPAFARQIGVRYGNSLKKITMKGGREAVTMMDLLMRERPCVVRMMRLELDLEATRRQQPAEVLETLAGAASSDALQLLQIQGLRLDAAVRPSLVNALSRLSGLRELRIVSFVGMHPKEEMSLVSELLRSQRNLEHLVLSSRHYHVVRGKGGQVCAIEKVDKAGHDRQELELFQGSWPSFPG